MPPDRQHSGPLDRFRPKKPKPDKVEPSTPDKPSAIVSVSEKHKLSPEQNQRLLKKLEQAQALSQSTKLEDLKKSLELFQQYQTELIRITEGKDTLPTFLSPAFTTLETALATRFTEFGLTLPTLEAPEVPPDVTAEHFEALAEIFGTEHLELSVMPTPEQLTDQYFQAMYPETQREEDTARGLVSCHPTWWKQTAPTSLVGSTEATAETYGQAYIRSMKQTATNFQNTIIFTENIIKPNYTDGSQHYGTKEGNDETKDPLLSIFQEVFGTGANRFNHSHDELITQLLPIVKEKIQQKFTTKGLPIPNFEVILTPNLLFNQQTTLTNPENSQTDTSEWNHDPLLRQDNTDSGNRLMAGHSGYGGAGYVNDDSRGSSWGNGGCRLSVVFRKV